MSAAVTAACDVRVDDGGLSFDVARGRASDEWTRTYTVASGGHIEIVNAAGAIEATRASGAAVEVVARREARGGGDEAALELLASLEMGEEVTADRVRVEARRGPAGRRGGPVLTIDYEVRLPAGVGATLTTENGEVRLEALPGHVVASSVNGRIRGRSLTGSVEASTVNGGIDLDFEALAADTMLRVLNGAVRVSLAPDVSATLDLSVVNGGISVDERLSLAGETRTPRRVSGTLNGGGAALVVETTNGGVRIVLRGALPERPVPN